MSLLDMWESVISYNNHYRNGWRRLGISEFTNDLASEVGEVCHLAKDQKGRGTSGHLLPLYEKWGEELVDVFIQLVLVAEKNKIDSVAFVYFFEEKMSEIMRRTETRIVESRPPFEGMSKY